MSFDAGLRLDPGKRYRIEFRTYNIGSTGQAGGGFGLGFGHNFIAVVELSPDGRSSVVGELHGMPRDRASRNLLPFDIRGAGRLEVVRGRNEQMGPRFYEDSRNHPSFVLIEGGGAAVKARLDRAAATAAWINRQDFGYELVGNNSNAVAHTLARAMGFDVTGQPIDRAEV